MRCVDLFAGAGGFSTGATMAGAQVVWAANHWPLAVKYHAANHPGTDHACQDLQQADWSQVPAHDLLLASPCCQGHSPARGKAHGNPQHDASRSTAWAVVSAAEQHRPAGAVIENVPEFMGWALYPAWKSAMEALGYTLAPHVLDAADHGVPQHRERLFIVATRSKAALQLQLQRRDPVPASTFVDFGAGRWSVIDKPGRSPRTLARVAAGRAAHGHRFLAPYYGSGSGATGRSLQRPIGTITTKDRWSVIDGERMRMLTACECRAAMGFPADYQLPPQHHQAVHLLGNAVCPPVARDVISALMAKI
ncbi:DNA cytosine methyltransferase [Comamonas aquatica]|uniref:DNA cytosine methyltransferase n=1 Tax=Comamonas aquatica TaxID=225991 RepID=UPI0005A616F7|nr:DNA cytosine methyltransferase [Comamonas aquatica]MDH1904146.1 DNA cytosine methyltransferase [Comamonas aquatica]